MQYDQRVVAAARSSQIEARAGGLDAEELESDAHGGLLFDNQEELRVVAPCWISQRAASISFAPFTLYHA